MFESGQFYIVNAETGKEELAKESEGFYTTLLVLGAFVLIGSMVYYAIVFIAEVFGHVPNWVRKCCISKKTARLGSHRFSMDSELEMHHNPAAGGENAEFAEDLRRAELERAAAAKRAEERRLKQEGAMQKLNAGGAMRATPRKKKDK